MTIASTAIPFGWIFFVFIELAAIIVISRHAMRHHEKFNGRSGLHFRVSTSEASSEYLRVFQPVQRTCYCQSQTFLLTLGEL
jgi:hypothetical protein